MLFTIKLFTGITKPAKKSTFLSPFREWVSMGAVGAQTSRSLGHHLLHRQIFRFLVLLKPADFERQLIFGHLICTLISENQGLEKLWSVSNLRKISGPAHLIFFSVRLSFFFSVCHLSFFQVYGTNFYGF